MNLWGWFFFAFLGLAVGAILYSWWHKFVTNTPEKYGKGPGHDLRGPERMQWDRPDRREGR
ncbi:hypothetical protein JANAI62_28100 [Jannaschia pagri]|uniref:Uncharacterized protein n=1 Tax=Jannaschia pagri TaxID=2829797 RepID=A0ABQ4NP43_9RHOB|nr:MULTISPECIES: hypothetical protein [unclassified Jannaschia]GIT92352.1 hypothetical protein JANAI61_28100 [Jannaschia sp. AI_61]GIT96187.1 hypothetical protein JANAI62_28100 [Jannaschia sp. AI_62]